jgi:CHASE2 domain-containing sensor protein
MTHYREYVNYILISILIIMMICIISLLILQWPNIVSPLLFLLAWVLFFLIYYHSFIYRKRRH